MRGQAADHLGGLQHLIRRLEGEGEDSAARLAKQLGWHADMARDLAYRLYQICERNKWAEEARAYNGLMVAWPALVNIATRSPTKPRPAPPRPSLRYDAGGERRQSAW